MHLSARYGTLEAVQYWLDQDVSIDAVDNVGVGVAMDDFVERSVTE
jgi:hypothetical protein